MVAQVHAVYAMNTVPLFSYTVFSMSARRWWSKSVYLPLPAPLPPNRFPSISPSPSCILALHTHGSVSSPGPEAVGGRLHG